jgi:hypothetical protein
MRAFVVLCLAAFALALPSAAAARDRDHDGLPDRWERTNHLSTKKKSSNGDPDLDRVDNRNEYREGTSPRDRDSDNDRRGDGREDRDRDGLSNAGEDLTGNDPRNADSDGDEVRDGKEAAGVVTSFAEGVLTIELAGGGTVGAVVTEGTEVECESEDIVEATYARVSRRSTRRSTRKRQRRRAASAGYDDPEIEEDPEEGEDPGEESEESEESEEEGEESEEGSEELGEGDCPADALGPGARVRDADLRLSESGYELDYIGLLR